jgi:hypothetical protein
VHLRDKQAEKSLCSIEESKIAAQNHQCRLKAAKTAVESELADAIAIEQSEAEHVRVIILLVTPKPGRFSGYVRGRRFSLR